jgi:hypothetical protein
MIITSRLNGSIKIDTSLLPVQFIENLNVSDSNQNTAVNVRLLCGADLLESFAVPGLWNDDDVNILLFLKSLVIYKFIKI